MPADWALAASVNDKLTSDKALSRDNIEVTAQNGVVTLTGSVGNDLERDRAIRDASGISGVARVQDNISIIERDF